MYNNRRVIATLTSIPSRMEYLHHCLQSLIQQTMPADEIVLSLPHKSVREDAEYEISSDVQKLIDKGNVELLRCKDYGPATKLLGVLNREKGQHRETEPVILYFDDDTLYHLNAIENLLSNDILETGGAVCRKGNIIHKDPWGESWGSCVNVKERTELDTAFGCGGVGVRPSYFDERVFKHEVDGSFYVDDIHISGNLRRNGIKLYTEPCEPSDWQAALQETGHYNEIDPGLKSAGTNPLFEINRENLMYTVNTLEHFCFGSTTG